MTESILADDPGAYPDPWADLDFTDAARVLDRCAEILSRLQVEHAAELRVYNRLTEVSDVADAIDLLLEKVPDAGLAEDPPEDDTSRLPSGPNDRHLLGPYWRHFDDWGHWQERLDRVSGLLARVRTIVSGGKAEGEAAR